MAIFLSFVVESVCSMLFVLIGCGSTIAWPQEETSPSVLSVSLCFGSSCAFLLNTSTCFSGGFFNPALTTALAANKTLSVKRALCYILAHLIGGKLRALIWVFILIFFLNSVSEVPHTASACRVKTWLPGKTFSVVIFCRFFLNVSLGPKGGVNCALDV